MKSASFLWFGMYTGNKMENFFRSFFNMEENEILHAHLDNHVCICAIWSFGSLLVRLTYHTI